MIRRSYLVLTIGFLLVIVIGWVRSTRHVDEVTLLTSADTRYAFTSRPHALEMSIATNFDAHPITWDPIFSTPTSKSWTFHSQSWRQVNELAHGESPANDYYSDEEWTALNSGSASYLKYILWRVFASRPPKNN